MTLRSIALEILAVSFVWLAAFIGIGVGLAFAFASHASGVFAEIGLLFGTVGAAGEIAYIGITRLWRRLNSPRWLLVSLWVLIVSSTIELLMGIAKQQTGIIEGLLFLFALFVVPVFAVAYIASWPFRVREAQCALTLRSRRTP